MEMLSRLKSDDSSRSADTQEDVASPALEFRASAWRPSPPERANFPEPLQDAGEGQVTHAKKVFADFQRQLQRSSELDQLLQSWFVVKQCRPFVVTGDGVRLAEDETGGSDVLQMLPADEFADRAAGTNHRSMFVGATPSDGAQRSITVANEAVVVSMLVENLHALGARRRAIGLFESYNRERTDWLKKRAALDDSPAFGDWKTAKGGKDQKKLETFMRATRLWLPARSAYLKSLSSTKRYRQVVEFAREDSRNLDVVCGSVANMASFLIGCRKHKDSALARLAIDTMPKRIPAMVLPLAFYELAFKSAMQKKNRDDDDLQNALWIARAMREDAGYVLHPNLWFTLFNTSLHLKREDCAIDVFCMYSNNFTSLHQDHFRRALRKACRLNHPDVALTMVRQWLVSIAGDFDTESRKKVVGFVLWEMLSSGHPISAITEMIAIIDSFQIEIEPVTLLRAVQSILNDTSSRLSPQEAVQDSLEFWKAHNSAVQNPLYPLHLLIQQCLEHDWLDECELIVTEMAQRRLPRVPCNGIVKVLAVNEERGRFEENMRMCDVLVTSLSRRGLKSLNQQFFERYLKALLCLGRFGEVRKQHARLNLGKRYPKSTPIAVALRDAKAHQK
ncbi:unnamed protein product [Phytophthora fragariaefolia]|uniref:Unnamed protein product n=1 Tax=Phytophthora fragariaefolia TaxID=1490495 RepID=A0A9W6XWH6_9STRA|nr:unnamed protein product [Phytophthora fragariaefolia]